MGLSSSVFVNGLEEIIEDTFTKLADGTRLGKTANRPAGRAAIHKDLEMPKEWARGNLIKFIKDRYKMLPVGRKHWCKDMSGWQQLCKKGSGALPWLQSYPTAPSAM